MILKTIVNGLLFLWVCMGFCVSASADQGLENQNQCVQCHTDLKKLIRLCWEVEKIHPRLQTSKETSGEG